MSLFRSGDSSAHFAVHQGKKNRLRLRFPPAEAVHRSCVFAEREAEFSHHHVIATAVVR